MRMRIRYVCTYYNTYIYQNLDLDYYGGRGLALLDRLQGKVAPLTGSSPNKKMLYFLINNKPILIRSMLAAGIVPCLLEKLEKAKEDKRRRLEATSTAILLVFLPLC